MYRCSNITDTTYICKQLLIKKSFRDSDERTTRMWHTSWGNTIPDRIGTYTRRSHRSRVTMVVIHVKMRCAVITHEERVIIYTFHEYTYCVRTYVYMKEVCFSHEVIWRLGSTTGVTRYMVCTRCITSTQISTVGPWFIVLVKQIGSARMFYVIVQNTAEISPITIIITIELPCTSCIKKKK